MTSRHSNQRTRASVVLALAVCASSVALPKMLAAQTATRGESDAPSRSAETRKQTDSLTVHFLRTPKGKPAALSIGGKAAAQARKFDGKPEPTVPEETVDTPLPTRARSTKP